MQKILERFLFEKPKAVIVLVFISFLLLLTGVFYVKLDFGVRIWFPEDTEHRADALQGSASQGRCAGGRN